MKNTVLKFGLAAGAILAVPIAVMVPLSRNGAFSFDRAELLGYTVMVLAFLLIFFGIRSYRDHVAGGTVTFGRALKVGLLMTLVASACYVAAWEIVYWGFLPGFGDKYAAHLLENMRAKGASDAVLAAKTAEMLRFKELYKNPLVNVGMTFVEVFPIGFVVALISAAFLKRRGAEAPAPQASPR